jgi:hypothetical protein
MNYIQHQVRKKIATWADPQPGGEFEFNHRRSYIAFDQPIQSSGRRLDSKN